jgi:predicted ATP-dependent endonuclease of OLD family
MKDMNVFYISDNRNEWDQEQDDINHRKYQQPKDPVEKEMNLLNDWIISQALEASKKGEEGTSEIYVKILSKLGKKKQEESSMTLEDISKEIELLDSRAKSYAQMGFIPDTDYSEVKSKLNKVLELNKEPAANILTPYLEIQKNRLDALDNLFKTITYFCDSLNEYLYKKRVYYSVSRGFLFYQMVDGENELPKLVKSKNEIDIKRLSSGERQLLRLFGMVIRNSQAAPIIIIDEPEISLNIKWQRRLLSTLSFFVRNNEAQFLIATHSFEILSSHIDNTVKLGDSYFPANHV